MAIISVDTETYQLYDGTKECEEEIQNAQPYQKIPKLTKGVK